MSIPACTQEAGMLLLASVLQPCRKRWPVLVTLRCRLDQDVTCSGPAVHLQLPHIFSEFCHWRSQPSTRSPSSRTSALQHVDGDGRDLCWGSSSLVWAFEPGPSSGTSVPWGCSCTGTTSVIQPNAYSSQPVFSGNSYAACFKDSHSTIIGSSKATCAVEWGSVQRQTCIIFYFETAGNTGSTVFSSFDIIISEIY